MKEREREGRIGGWREGESGEGEKGSIGGWREGESGEGESAEGEEGR